MRHIVPICMLGAWALASGCAGPQQGQRGFGPDGRERAPRPYANPSQVIVAELAFARLARDEGQWTAFRETAAEDAVMFVPGPVAAQAWLKDRADPPEAVQWQPHQVFMACDGATGASTGAWQRPDGSTGYFTTIWQREGDDNGRARAGEEPRWHWVLDHGDVLAAPREMDGDMIASRVASCTGNAKEAARSIPADTPIVPAASGTRAARDGTLIWSWQVDAKGARTVSVSLWNGNGYDVVLND